MAKLFFRYGAMNSGKSTQLLQVRHNYHEMHQRTLLIKPALDDRDGVGLIRPRIGGLSVKVDHTVMPEDDLFDLVAGHQDSPPDCVIVDEVQFLTPAQIWQLTDVVDRLGIPVMCYGLRADFQGRLFPATETLLAVADNIEELKTICWCGKKAVINARIIDGHVVREGQQLWVGGNSLYRALCRAHWKADRIRP